MRQRSTAVLVALVFFGFSILILRLITLQFFQGEFLSKMASGVKILGTTTLPCKITKTGEKAFTIILTQGLNRQIRRMCETLGYRVRTLKRVRIMNIHLGNLKLGQWRNLTPFEMTELMRQLDEAE